MIGLKKQFVKLGARAKIDGINFEYIHVSTDEFERDEIYYARIALPVFPKRNMPLYLKGSDAKTCEIVRMHDDDEVDLERVCDGKGARDDKSDESKGVGCKSCFLWVFLLFWDYFWHF